MKLFFLITSLLLTFSITAQSFKGKWEGTSNGEVGMITFDKAGYVTFTIAGESMGGKKFSSEGIDLSMRYEFNDDVDPHTLDFIISMMDGTEVARMTGIYKFTNAKTLILNMDFSGAIRPTEFEDDNQNQILLQKVK